jgi:hypothetical protein
MPTELRQLKALTTLVMELETNGFKPILVGGMALVAMGSQRVTNDFDFLVAKPIPSSKNLVEIMYKNKLELVTKFNNLREVQRTVDNPRIAAIKIDEEAPKSVTFYSWDTKLQIDLLLDFPLPAQAIAGRAIKVSFLSHSMRIATPKDLLELKEIAYKDRKSANDVQDLEFLRGRMKKA